MKLSKIKLNPSNPRTIKDERFEKLCNSLKTFAEKMMPLRPIVIDEDGIILGGNMRFKALKELGFKEVPDDWVKQVFDLSEDEKKEFIVKDNVGFGDWDFEELETEWDKEQLEEWGLDLPSFDEEENVLEAKEDDYQEPSNLQVDVVLGDLIEIGVHRLLCGDSTDSDAVAKLMNGDKADICICDPPYGINVVENNSRMKQLGWEQYENDGSNEVAVDAFNLAITICDRLVFWGANHYASELPNVGGWLVWDKQDGKDTTTYSMGELAWTNVLNNVQIFKHIWDGFRKDSEKGEKRLHPSQKPVKLHEWVLGKIDDAKLMLDLFCGSGSTMVAAHQLNRKCYGMELDPKYCQVIIDRMAKLDPNLKIKINGVPYEPKTEKVPF